MIQDFKCTYGNSAGIREEVTNRTHLTFPDAYKHAETMAELAQVLKECDKAPFCELPFCHTVEAEAMGGIINYGNEKTGPRAKEYLCTEIEEILDLPEIDFEKGRIQEVLQACRILHEKGEHIVFDVSGPLTILNVLIDPRYVFKGMRKKPELMAQIFAKLGKEILAYMKLAKEHGADLISYADSFGGVNILGPKMAEQMVDLFTYDFVKQAEKLADGHTMILLCPKTTFALLGTGKAELLDRRINKDTILEEDTSPEGDMLSYAEACIRMKGEIRLAGQMCIKNLDYRIKNGSMKEVHIL